MQVYRNGAQQLTPLNLAIFSLIPVSDNPLHFRMVKNLTTVATPNLICSIAKETHMKNQ